MGQADAVVCSPPYADSQVGSGKGGRTGWRGYTDFGGGTYATVGQVGALRTGPCPGGEAGVGDDVETLEWGGCYKDSWKGLIVPEAFAHPAKVARGLAVRLFDHGFERGWWRKNDLVCDPFMGICGFGIIAAYKGLRFVGVEIEERFHSLCLENVALHRRRWEAGGDVPPACLRGDSRQFAALVAGAVACVTSPPYAGLALDPGESSRPEAKVARLLAEGKYREAEVVRRHGSGPHSNLRQQDYGATPGQLGALPAGDADSVITSPPYAGAGEVLNAPSGIDHGKAREGGRRKTPARAAYGEGYGTTPGQLGALPQGDADSVITSPPWVDPRALSPRDNAAWVASGRLPSEGSGPGTDLNAYGATPGHLGALPAGDAEAVLTSPPYAEGLGHGGGKSAIPHDTRGTAAAMMAGYGGTPGNVGGLAAGDAGAIVTSPPYEGCEVDGEGRTQGSEALERKRSHLAAAGHDADKWLGNARCTQVRNDGYGTAPGQVGALRQETYWSACRDIYLECFKVLKPSGVMAVVIKDFVRAKKRVPLCDQTWRLLLSLGFLPVERIRCLLSEETREPSLFGGECVRRTERQSFFRRLATKKGAPSIDYEEILVVRRPSGGAEG